MKTSKNPEPGDSRPSLLQIAGSVIAAAFGVQSRRHRERDFGKGRAHVYIAGGVLFTLALVIGIYAVVQMVLKEAGL